MTKDEEGSESQARNLAGLAESNLQRAREELESARGELQRCEYAKSVHSSQTCIELSMKSVYRFLGKNFTLDHRLKDDQFVAVLDQVPRDLEYHNFPRLFVLALFWAHFYNMSKYDHEKLGVGPEKLFAEHEARLALTHAEESFSAAEAIRFRIQSRSAGSSHFS